MAVQVANTSSNLSGKTVMAAENAETVTGLKTFDRDPAAPFAVTASSASVANLDADKVDGLNAAEWQSYSPTLTNITIGNGTVTAMFRRFGKSVEFWVRIVFGTTSSMGTDPRVSVPTSIDSNESAVGSPIGVGVLTDTGVQNYVGVPFISSSTEVRVFAFQVSGSNVIYAATTATVPFTWGNTDSLFIAGSYQAASAL